MIEPSHPEVAFRNEEAARRIGERSGQRSGPKACDEAHPFRVAAQQLEPPYEVRSCRTNSICR